MIPIENLDTRIFSHITFYSRGKMEIPNLPDISFVTFDYAPLYGVATLVHVSNTAEIPAGRYITLYSPDKTEPERRVQQIASYLTWSDRWFDNAFNAENHDKGCASNRADLKYSKLEREYPDLAKIVAAVLCMTEDEFEMMKYGSRR